MADGDKKPRASAVIRKSVIEVDRSDIAGMGTDAGIAAVTLAVPVPAAVAVSPVEPRVVAAPLPEVMLPEHGALQAPAAFEASPAPVAAAPAFPDPATQPKEIRMNETYNATADAVKNGAEQVKNTMANHTETAMAQTKATFEQVSHKSREAMEHGMKSMDDMAGMARGNVEAMLASSRAAANGIESIAREVADYSRKSFEEVTAAARAMATVKTPNELMQIQNDFAKSQFDSAVAEMSKLSETMVKLMGEVFEPVQNRAAATAEKMKSMTGNIGR